MSNAPQTSEIPGQNPDPVQLLNSLDAMDTDQKKHNHLRDLFLEEADVNEYLQLLDADEEIELTKKQLTKLKGALEGFKTYLKDYLERTGKSLEKFDERFKTHAEKLAEPQLTPEEAEKLAKTRVSFAKAMKAVAAPRGAKGRSLREAAGKTGEAPTAVKLEDKTEEQYVEFIDGLNLTPEKKEKLRNIVSGYEEAVETAREKDANIQVPSREQVIAHILALGAAKLEKITEIMGKPDLVIEADKSMEQMKDAMNANRHYDDQNEAYLAADYEWSGKPGKVSVSIMDMVQNSAVVPGQKPGEQRNDEQLRICEKYFRDNGMRLAGDLQFAAGMQKSLRAYEQAKKNGEPNPEKYILDFYGQPKETVTMFNQEHNSTISKVAVGFFIPDDREVFFRWYGPVRRNGNLRGRGAVQVM